MVILSSFLFQHENVIPLDFSMCGLCLDLSKMVRAGETILLSAAFTAAAFSFPSPANKIYLVPYTGEPEELHRSQKETEK
jgi:hypothetical protein